MLSAIPDTDWSDCPADLGIIEQVMLARNRGQHGDSLLTLNVTPTIRECSRNIRVRSLPATGECDTWARIGGNPDSLLTPSIKISSEALFWGD